MCLGIALAGSELPTELTGRKDLTGRLYCRSGRPEYRFLHRHSRPRLPIWRDGQFQIVRWGNARGQSKKLPRTGWTWQSTLDEGKWANIDLAMVDIPASWALDGRGIWYVVEVGIKAILVPDEHGIAVCYMLCEKASHYYKNMTGSERTPVLINQTI